MFWLFVANQCGQQLPFPHGERDEPVFHPAHYVRISCRDYRKNSLRELFLCTDRVYSESCTCKFESADLFPECPDRPGKIKNHSILFHCLSFYPHKHPVSTILELMIRDAAFILKIILTVSFHQLPQPNDPFNFPTDIQQNGYGQGISDML